MNSTTNKPIYPQNAYCAIFGEPEYNKLPADAEETLEYIFDTLTQRETEVFKLSFINEWSLRDIGEKLGYTQESVRQILAKAIRRLQHPSRSKILLYGLEAYLTKIVAVNEEEKRKYNERIAGLNEQIRQQNAEIAAYQETMINLEKQVDPAYDILCQSIDCLNLSVRAWNCLTRAGIHTIKEIMDYGDILRIRNLGQRSAHEVDDKVTALLKTSGYKYVSLQLNRPLEENVIGWGF